MEIKGIIELGENKSLTCCSSLQDLTIDGVSLYDTFEDLFNQDTEDYWNDFEKESPQFSMRYVVLEEPPKDESTSFESLSAEVVMNNLYCELISGCYSEWTCGYGGFDYINGSHSIFKELEGSIGKYVHIKM